MICCLIGFFPCIINLRFYFLPLFMGKLNIALFIIVTLLCAKYLSTFVLFFAQHAWDEHEDESISNTNWGYYNLKGTFSIHPNGSWRPMFWGYNGACPSTLSYHVEHTLFPGIPFAYHSYIASTVEEVAKKYGYEYRKIIGMDALE